MGMKFYNLYNVQVIQKGYIYGFIGILLLISITYIIFEKKKENEKKSRRNIKKI
jgi:TM2 domain-containing membrane protein YozV